MLIFGIDKFMSECRALVNFYGNAVATLFIATWEKGLDLPRARQVLAGEVVEVPAAARPADHAAQRPATVDHADTDPRSSPRSSSSRL